MKIANQILACIVGLVAHATAYVVDRGQDISPANHYDDTVSSGETPTILDLLTSLDVQLQEGHKNLGEAKKAAMSRRSARDVGCKNPSEEKLRSQLLEAKFFGSSIRQTEYEDQFQAFEDTFGSPYSHIGEECPAVSPPSDLLNESLNKRSSCPWKYETNSDNNRYPKDILYAKCECTKCIEGNERGGENSCKPILEPRYVLKRAECGVDNEYQYILSEEHVSVGCACSRSSTT